MSISTRLAELATCVLGVGLSGCIRRAKLPCISRTIVLSGSASAVVENGLYPLSNRDRVVVLPEPQYDPPRLGQFTVCALVATPVRFKFGGPPLAIRLREGSVRRTAMPKASVHVDRDSCPREDHVCSPRAGGNCSIDVVAQSEAVQCRPQGQLRLRVSASRALHALPC